MDSSILRKYEKKDTKALLRIAERYFNHWIRLRDSENGRGRCISSGQPLVVPSLNAHAGHFYNAGSYPHMKFVEDNCHLQGRSDNYFKSANLLEYRKNLIAKIGIERVEALDQMSEMRHKVHRWDRTALICIIEEYREKVKQLKKAA